MTTQPTGEAARSHSAGPAVRDSRWSSPASVKPAAESSRQPAADANPAALSASKSSKPAAQLSPQPSANPSASGEKPSNAATVASAIEETMKQGNAPGTDAGDSDAWLARIHLLNGGQNMPKFGGFGSNGSLDAASGSPLGGLSTDEEAQAAKKAERAVADAWGAGKNVWQKNQQQRPEQPSSQATSPPVPATAAAQISQPTAQKDASAARASAELTKAEVTESSAKDSPKPTTTERSSGKKASSKEGSNRKGQQAAAPSFEDVSKWPAPVEAVKKSTDKAKSPTLSAEAAQTSISPQTEKSIYETLSELQLEVAPGAAPHAATGSVANGRKGKQWISIVPNITHASSNQKQQPRAGDAKGKGNNKLAKKEKTAQRQARSPHNAKKEELGGNAAPGDAEAGHASAVAQLEQPQGAPESTGPQGQKAEPSAALPAPDAAAPHARDGSPAKQAPHLSRNSSGQGSRTYSPIQTPPSGTPRMNGSMPGPHNYTSPRGSMAYPMQPPFGPRSGGMSPSSGFHPNGGYPMPAGRGSGWTPFMPYARPPLPPQLLEQTSQTGAPIPSGTPGQLLGQIEFYFSQRNLEGDFFLRQKMDGQGWVDISVVAAFKRVQNITRDLRLIEDALLHSAVLDVDTERKKVRRRYGWEMFVLPEGGSVSMQHSAEAHGSTGASATPTASRGSTGLASPPSSFSRSSEDVSDANGHDDDEHRSKDQGGDDDDQILGIVASSGLGGTLDKHSSAR